MSDDLIGKVIGQYQIVEQIGKGGMATVYKAYQPAIDRHVAVKILPGEFANDPNFVKRFAHEAKAIAALEHPHILPVHDFGFEDKLNYMVVRYVKGGTLSDLMGKPMPYERVVQIISNMARALDYAHRRGVVHRDIKPSNILVDEHGEVLLTDFGIAKLIEDSSSTQLTATGSVLGTPAYMAPEQAQGQKIDGRTDIYSLGVVLYELLTGRPPYEAETPYAVVFKHVNEPLPLPRSINPDIPEPLEQVVLKAMAKEPEQRFETAGQMAQALQEALKTVDTTQATAASQPLTIPHAPQATGAGSPPATPLKETSKSNKPLIIGAVVVILLLCLAGGGVALLFLLASGEGETPQAGVSSAVNIEAESQAERSLAAEADTAQNEEPVADDVLFEDRFDSNENDWFVGQDSDEYGYFEANIADGLYQIYLNSSTKEGNFGWVEPFGQELENFEMVVAFEYVEASTSDYTYGVAFRTNLQGDAYMFQIDNDGYMISLTQANGNFTMLQDYTPSAAINPNGPNEVIIVADDSALDFFINGTEVANLTDSTLAEGSIGIIVDVLGDGNEMVVEVDRIVIYNLATD